jgi:hypothetical protein
MKKMRAHHETPRPRTAHGADGWVGCCLQVQLLQPSLLLLLPLLLHAHACCARRLTLIGSDKVFIQQPGEHALDVLRERVPGAAVHGALVHCAGSHVAGLHSRRKSSTCEASEATLLGQAARLQDHLGHKSCCKKRTGPADCGSPLESTRLRKRNCKVHLHATQAQPAGCAQRWQAAPTDAATWAPASECHPSPHTCRMLRVRRMSPAPSVMSASMPPGPICTLLCEGWQEEHRCRALGTVQATNRKLTRLPCSAHACSRYAHESSPPFCTLGSMQKSHQPMCPHQ